MSCGKTFLTEDILAMIGQEAEQIEVTLWGIEKEGLRRFTQALMDPDPRSWDEEFAKSTRYGEIVTPGIFATYLDRTHPSADDPVTRAFKNNPVSDGIGGMDTGRPGQLPPLPTELVRVLNAGNEIEVLRYPSLGDRVFSQTKLANVVERTGRDGNHMLIVTNETTFTNQNGEVLCISRASSIRR